LSEVSESNLIKKQKIREDLFYEINASGERIIELEENIVRKEKLLNIELNNFYSGIKEEINSKLELFKDLENLKLEREELNKKLINGKIKSKHDY
jgi:hypothetical protein